MLPGGEEPKPILGRSLGLGQDRSCLLYTSRAAALFAVALYSEVMLSENPDREEALGFVSRVDEGYHIMDEFTPLERAYLDTPSPEQYDCIQFLWRYECCAVLLWTLGIIDLPYPCLLYTSDSIDVMFYFAGSMDVS